MTIRVDRVTRKRSTEAKYRSLGTRQSLGYFARDVRGQRVLHQQDLDKIGTVFELTPTCRNCVYVQ